MAKRSVTRAARRQSPSSSHHSRKQGDGLTYTPAERLDAILQGYREHASSVPANPLVSRKSPQEALLECIKLAQWLAFVGEGRGGNGSVGLMLAEALTNIRQQLEPLFDAAQQAAQQTGAWKKRVVLGEVPL